MKSDSLWVGCTGFQPSFIARAFWSYDLSVVPLNVELEQAYLGLRLKPGQAPLDDTWASLKSLTVGRVTFAPPLAASSDFFDLAIQDIVWKRLP